MEISSRTTEGLPNDCPVCGKKVWIVPSTPPGDAVCPHCGSAVWFPDVSDARIPDVARRLEQLGAIVDIDDEGQVRSIRLVGHRYDDTVIRQLAKLRDVKSIDVRETRITAAGVARLRELLPGTRIDS